jgi:L,D-transpeptidase catalytic domain
MRSLLIAATLMLFAAGAAQAKVAITVDKDAQMMTVAVDGVERYHWPVSTGNPSHETPNGSFRTFRMEEDHYSKEFDDAPMPHSIFFTKIGHAIHGTESEGRLGTPVSHGCVRLSRANATTLYALVQEQGVLNTTVTLTGSSTVALARNPRPRTAIARHDPAPEYAPQYGDAAGDPTSLAPQVAPQMAPRQVMPQQVLPQVLPQALPQVPPQARADDGYIYPADGSSTDQRYPAPRPSRRAYDGQAYYYQQQQPQGYDAYGNAYQQPRSYYQQQQPRYYYPN